jgi:hypothetical protein
MQKKITPKPSYIVSLLFLVPIVGTALYGAFFFLAQPNTEGFHLGMFAVGLGILAFGGFMGFLIVKGILYVVNFRLSFDEKNVEITTYLGERTTFRWEDIKDVNHYTTGEQEIVLKTGKSVRFKSRMLEMGAFFRAYNGALESRRQ